MSWIHIIAGSEALLAKTRSKDIRPVHLSTDNSRSKEDYSRTLDSLLQRKRQIPRLVNVKPSNLLSNFCGVNDDCSPWDSVNQTGFQIDFNNKGVLRTVFEHLSTSGVSCLFFLSRRFIEFTTWSDFKLITFRWRPSTWKATWSYL